MAPERKLLESRWPKFHARPHWVCDHPWKEHKSRRRMSKRVSQEETSFLTFYSWVTEWPWYDYAQHHPKQVPILLIDRALCEEPFLDAFASSPADRQAVISGVCRNRKPKVGDRLIYRTRINRLVAKRLGINQLPPLYFVVAALRVEKVYKSHEAASHHFTTRRYVTAPNPTPYPPNLVHALEPVAAVCRENCIVFRAPGSSAIDPKKRIALMPSESTEADRQKTYLSYHKRMRESELHAALCRIEIVNGREALALDPASAPLLGADESTKWKESGNGRCIPEEFAADLRDRIAAVGQLVS